MYRTALSHIPHLRSFSAVSGCGNSETGAFGRASFDIALLSQINPPNSQTAANKMLMESMATDYSPRFQ
jgi:hypothetical protein